MTDPFVGTETADAWAKWTGTNFSQDGQGLIVAPQPAQSFVSPRPAFDDWPATDRPVDLDIGPCGTVYVLAARDGPMDQPPVGHLYRVDPRSGSLDRLACLGSEEWFSDPRALCVTEETIYVATGDGGALYAFSRHLLQLRWRLDRPFVDPVAMVADGTNAFVMDTGPFADETGAEGGGDQPDPDADPTPDDGSFIAVVGVDGDVDVLPERLASPVDLAIDSKGTLYALVAGPRIHVYRGNATTLTEEGTSVWLEPEAFPTAPGADGAPVPVSPSCLEGVDRDDLVLGVSAASAGEPTLYRYRVTTGRFTKLPGFKRAAARLRYRHADERGLYVVQAAEREVSFLEAVTRRQRNPETGRYDAQAVRTFDSGEAETEWHRLTLAFTADDPGTQVTVRYAATEFPPEQPAALASEWHVLPANPADALFEEAVGRYLSLELTLTGTEVDSPRVDALRSYFPRQSYLRYLPAIYREDEASARFLERYLSIFESTFVGVEEDLATMTRLFDPEGAPDDSLTWLAGWLALAVDETWSPDAKRRLLASAPELFKQRGTRAGLHRLLSLFLGAEAEDPAAAGDIDSAVTGCPRLNDLDESRADDASDPPSRPFFVRTFADLDCIDDVETRAAYTGLLGCPQCLLVALHPDVDAEQARGVRRLVERALPGHAAGRTVHLSPWVELGGHAYLGVNSTLPERELVVETASLGKDTILTDYEPFAQLERQSRLGEDTIID